MNIKKTENIRVITNEGIEPRLPRKVTVELENGIQTELNVEWEDFNLNQYDKVGKYEVQGKIKLLNYLNPLVEQRADPFIYRHIDGYYYFTGSYPEYDRIVLRRSKTINGLKKAKEVVLWRKREHGIMSSHIWAPEIHFIDGKWYIHFAAGADDEWAIRPYVLECSDTNPLEGNWIEKGQVNTNFDSFSLDATTFEHDGKRYLVWAQTPEKNTTSCLYIAEMSNPWTIKGKQILLSEPDLEWEQQGYFVNEGAAFIRKKDKVFIAYSGSATDDRYAVGLLCATATADLLDPKSWTKLSDPVFVSNEEAMEFGPGHNSFTIAEDGETDLIVYHARPYKKIEKVHSLYDHNRHARVQQIMWDQNGNPYFGKPGHSINNPNVKAEIIVKRKNSIAVRAEDTL